MNALVKVEARLWLILAKLKEIKEMYKYKFGLSIRKWRFAPGRKRLTEVWAWRINSHMGLVKNPKAYLQAFSGGFVEAPPQTSGPTAGAGRGGPGGAGLILYLTKERG